MKTQLPHIVVCICTFRRAELLTRLLRELMHQETEGEFTYSVVVADNDAEESARGVVESFAACGTLKIIYCLEPRQNIALARNQAIRAALGDYIAFIDDDEFPIRRWLSLLFRACNRSGVDGVLGPVRCHFDYPPPLWILKGRFYDRPSHPTGHVLSWRQTRTGNVLFRRGIVPAGDLAFRPNFRMGEDQDFFRRMMDLGCKFIWCNEAVAYEVVPSARWKRRYILRRAMLGGAMEPATPTFRMRDLAKSLSAVVLYSLALPFAAMAGHHRLMVSAARLSYHLGTVLAYLGFNPIKAPYVTQ